MEDQELYTLSRIYYGLLDVETKGQSTLILADVIKSLLSLIETKKKRIENNETEKGGD